MAGNTCLPFSSDYALKRVYRCEKLFSVQENRTCVIGQGAIDRGMLECATVPAGCALALSAVRDGANDFHFPDLWETEKRLDLCAQVTKDLAT